MQMTLTLDACARCGQPILPGQPVKQTASVDIIDGRVVAYYAALLAPQGWRLPRRRGWQSARPPHRLDGCHQQPPHEDPALP